MDPLNDDIIHLILNLLDDKDWINFQMTCQRIYHIPSFYERYQRSKKYLDYYLQSHRALLDGGCPNCVIEHPDYLVKCQFCPNGIEKIMCKECCYRCKSCGKIFCDNCFDNSKNYCINCGFVIESCLNCQDEFVCNKSGKYFHEGCHYDCGNCGNCGEHTFCTANNCVREGCHSCMINCDKCKQEYCNDCIGSHACKKCDDCTSLRECDNCYKEYCENCDIHTCYSNRSDWRMGRYPYFIDPTFSLY